MCVWVQLGGCGGAGFVGSAGWMCEFRWVLGWVEVDVWVFAGGWLGWVEVDVWVCAGLGGWLGWIEVDVGMCWFR